MDNRLSYAGGQWTASLHNYEVEKEVASGSSASVYAAKHKPNGARCAIKVMRKAQLQHMYVDPRASVEREIALHRRVNGHRYIAELYATFEDNDNYYLVLEYAKGGDLLTRVCEGGPLTENEAKAMFQQLLEALNHCHKHNVLHADVKADNILLSEMGEVKLCDFGLAADLRSNDDISLRGTLVYFSPEALESGLLICDVSTDMWAATVTLSTSLSGMWPFYLPADLEPDQDANLTFKDKRRLMLECMLDQELQRDNLTLEAYDMMNRNLSLDPKKRLGMEATLNHLWFNAARQKLAVRPEPIRNSANYDFAPAGGDLVFHKKKRPTSNLPTQHRMSFTGKRLSRRSVSDMKFAPQQLDRHSFAMDVEPLRMDHYKSQSMGMKKN